LTSKWKNNQESEFLEVLEAIQIVDETGFGYNPQQVGISITEEVGRSKRRKL